MKKKQSYKSKIKQKICCTRIKDMIKDFRILWEKTFKRVTTAKQYLVRVYNNAYTRWME